MVWVTAQALTALARKPFPVAAPRRRAAPERSAAAPAAALAAPARLGGLLLAVLLTLLPMS